MTAIPHAPPRAEPGQWVYWRHPRLALARGWFNAFGPGPFQVVRVLADDVVVKTPAGEKRINALWVGLPS